MPEAAPGAPRHVTCVDCHDPHSSNPRTARAPDAPGPLAGVWGIDLNGQRVNVVRYEYEVCFKCHGDSANKPQASQLGLRTGPARAAGREPAAACSRATRPRPTRSRSPGRNVNVPSLKAPLNATSLIYCTDCHASDTGPGAGGEGARGPHGSQYAPLLERQYLTGDLTAESAAAYALCYKCHEREVLLSERSAFPSHRAHVVEQSAPCSACHAAHGVSRDAGNERNNAHLVSFDLAIVSRGESGPATYETLGAGHGTCALSCHGVTHRPSAPPQAEARHFVNSSY